MAVKILVDSTFDFTEEELAALGLEVVRMRVLFGDEEFVDGLYELLAASNARTLEELANPKKIMAIWRQYTQKDKEKRKQMGQILRRLARAAAWAVREQGKQNNNKRQPEG